MQGRKYYGEKLFINFQLSQRVPANNFYLRLNGILDLSYLRQMAEKYYGLEGQKSIDPIVFFKLRNCRIRITNHITMPLMRE